MLLIIYDHLEDYHVDKRMNKNHYMVKDCLNLRYGEKLYHNLLYIRGYNLVFYNDNTDDEFNVYLFYTFYYFRLVVSFRIPTLIKF